MSEKKSLAYYQRLFSTPADHTLMQVRLNSIEKKSTVYEIRWLEELDKEHYPVSRFRAWTNRSLIPPYRQQSGWERYSSSGALLDREVRYSQRDDNEYVH